jgi:retron-type reverse transcriptase
VDGLRRKHEEQHNRSAPEATSGQLQGAARQASLHPKADGKQRPLGIASLEDKIVQYALVKILNAVYENDFMGFSYGFRPGRSQHDALDALATGLVRTNVNWVLDADISQFFDRVSHEWLIRFTEHRIGDRRVIRLIRKWLTAGTSEEGQWRATEEGTHRVRSSHRCWQTYTSTTSSICGRISGDVAMPQAMW